MSVFSPLSPRLEQLAQVLAASLPNPEPTDAECEHLEFTRHTNRGEFPSDDGPTICYCRNCPHEWEQDDD